MDDDVLLIFLHQCCTLHFLLFASLLKLLDLPWRSTLGTIKLTVSKKYNFQRFSDQMSRSLLVQQDQSRYASHFPFFASSETFRSAAGKRTVTFTNRWRESATHDTIDPKEDRHIQPESVVKLANAQLSSSLGASSAATFQFGPLLCKLLSSRFAASIFRYIKRISPRCLA